VPTTPIGTLTQKTSRQLTSLSRPPAMSPMNWPASAATMLMPSAIPRWVTGNASVTIALELAITIAPPTPCTTRAPMSHIAPVPAWNGSSASSTDPAVKTAKPAL
jgi:hypothetical protein